MHACVCTETLSTAMHEDGATGCGEKKGGGGPVRSHISMMNRYNSKGPTTCFLSKIIDDRSIKGARTGPANQYHQMFGFFTQIIGYHTRRVWCLLASELSNRRIMRASPLENEFVSWIRKTKYVMHPVSQLQHHRDLPSTICVDLPQNPPPPPKIAGGGRIPFCKHTHIHRC